MHVLFTGLARTGVLVAVSTLERRRRHDAGRRIGRSLPTSVGTLLGAHAGGGFAFEGHVTRV